MKNLSGFVTLLVFIISALPVHATAGSSSQTPHSALAYAGVAHRSPRIDQFQPAAIRASAVTTPTVVTETLVLYGSAVNEDGEEFTANPNEFWVGAGGDTSHAGIRFANVTIPRNAKINFAKLEGSPTTDSWIILNYDLFAENSDNSRPFTSASRPSKRRLLAKPISFADDTTWTVGNYYDLGAVNQFVQSIVSRRGWKSGNALSFIARGNSPWSRKFLVNSGALAPRLTINYTYTTTR
jgi:hypothetical protein